MELWGGPECTVNRVGGVYRDQSHLSGHHHRSEDLDLFAALGVRRLRYPVLWERVAPDDPRRPDWRWTDERLGRLRDLDVEVIAGLVHHGSGPGYATLPGDGFARGLAVHAAAVAERYPWIEDWTPVNEPLTTARFTCLYGHWYPHARDEGAFWRAVLAQVDATRAAMAAVRRVNSRARLIQTDDLGRTYATAPLAEQAAFDNERRWAGWELLFGRVTTDHPLFERLAAMGLGDRLRRIADDPCPPDVVGVNHYLTSDRFLDHRIGRYPPEACGGNGTAAYADVEAVRVLEPGPQGLRGALAEAWARYRTPMAVTEVHLGCTREEQLRWVAEAWDTALALRADGMDVLAVTAWSLLGSFGWDTLLTGGGQYESGVWDLSEGNPRPTALAALWRGLPTGASRHPAAAGPGWWRRPSRLLYEPVAGPALAGLPVRPNSPILVAGDGELIRLFEAACAARGLAVAAQLAHGTHPWISVRPTMLAGKPVLRCQTGGTAIDLDRTALLSPAGLNQLVDAGEPHMVAAALSSAA